MLKKGLAFGLVAAMLIGLWPFGQPGMSVAEAAPGDVDSEKQHYYIIPRNFISFGSWTLTGEYVTGRATASMPGEGNGDEGERR
ncbi:hypothetical protein ABE504_21850 [Paenibacillus oryzisoli]|uniref:hypothetical protein n=1 Tax=Paenibacillus oryzisoli TaxID=1850517 RepID=UPI003D2DE4A0